MSDAARRDLSERMAVAEKQLQYLDSEMERVRKRLHELESDRATLRILMEQMETMGRRVTEVSATVEMAATRAAEKAVTLAFTDHEQIQELHEERKQARRKLWLQAGTFGLACGGFVASTAFTLVDRL